MPDPRVTDLALLVLRLGGAGLMLAFHGYGRLWRAVSYVAGGTAWPFVTVVDELGFPAAPLFAVASALAESVGAILVAVGLWTRLAGAALAANMLVAVLNEWSGGDPVELPAIYLVVSVAVALAGPGLYSLDAVLKRRRDARDRSAGLELPVTVPVSGSEVR